MESIIHDLVQGSAEWLLYRATHDNASDADAMLGVSPFKTRNQLIHERYLGMQPEFSQYVQDKILEPGHEFEALARELAQEALGEDLYPVVRSLGNLSASMDGETMDGLVLFEHKRLNAELIELFDTHDDGTDDGYFLPEYHRIQMEQQLTVAPAAARVFFMASKWNGQELLDSRSVSYRADFKMRQRIIDGWAQFHIDLAAYVPPKAEGPKAVGKTMEDLPALSVAVEGKVTATNVGAWKAHALGAIASVNRDLVTDEDFATADNMVKWCETVEDSCKTARAYTLSQTASIAEVLKALDDVQAAGAKCRLALKPLITERKQARKDEIVGGAVASMHKHIAELNELVTPHRLPVIAADFAAQILRKRDFKSMQNAVDTELARAKIEASGTALRMQVNLTRIRADADHLFLFNDAGDLILKDADAVEAIVQNRITAHKAAELAKKEAETARIRAEEQAKAGAAARANAAEILRQEREAQAERDRDAKAQANRIAANEAEEARLHENRKREEAEYEQRRQDAASLAERQQAEADLKQLGQPGAPVASAAEESIVSSSLESFENQPAYVHEVRRSGPAPTPPAPVEPEHAWINIGKMNEAFGYTVTADLIVNELNVPWTRTEKAAKFWTPTQFEKIKRLLAERTLKAMALPF